MTDPIETGTNRLRDLREEIREDDVLGKADLAGLVRAMVQGDGNAVKIDLEEAVVDFNLWHSAIYDKAAAVGASIGKALVNAGKSP